MNVGFCAFSIALHLGCSPIILTGMDLALPHLGQSHAKGSANSVPIEIDSEGHGNTWATGHPQSIKSFVQVGGYYGDIVYTFSYFKHVLMRFNSVISQCKARVIDATEGGARKSGCIRQPLHEVLQEIVIAKPVEFLKPLPKAKVSCTPETTKAICKLAHHVSAAHKQVQNGIHRIAEIKEQVNDPHADLHAIHDHIQIYRERWYALLESQDLDIALDIGLAYWRFAYRRAQAPSADLREQAHWWCEKMEGWFSGFCVEMENFLVNYSLVLEELKKQE